MAPLQRCDRCNKLVWIIAESGVETQLMETFEQLGIENYTLFEQIEGKGETGRKQGNAIFPGINHVIMVAVPEDVIDPLVERLHEIRDSYIVTPGMKIIVTDCVMY